MIATFRTAVLAAFTLSPAGLASDDPVMGPACWLELDESSSSQVLNVYASDITDANYVLTTRIRGSGQVLDSEQSGSVYALGETRLTTLAMDGSVPGSRALEHAFIPERARRSGPRARAVGRPAAKVSANLIILDEEGYTVCEARLD